MTTTETITTTVTAGPTLTLRRRAQVFYAPEWLNGVPTELICPACKIVWPPPPPKIVTVYRTTTVYNTKTKIVSSDALTTTETETVTPPEGVVTETQTTTLVYTESETSTPLITVRTCLTFLVFENYSNKI